MKTNKKQVWERLLSATLIVVLCFQLFSIPAQSSPNATLTNGMPVTEENVLALIEEYRNGKDPGQKAKDAGFTSYEDFSSYDAYNPPYSIMLFDGRHEGTECAKFAFAFFDDIFGSDATIRKITDPADVRPGDLIHVPGHWSVATEKARLDETSGFIRAFDVGAGNGSIGWSTVAVNITSADQIYTRYPPAWKFDPPTPISITKPIGTQFDSLGLPESVQLSATKEGTSRQFNIPVTWNGSGYDPYETDQVFEGMLHISGFPELSESTLPAITASIILTGDIKVTNLTIERPSVRINIGTDYSKIDEELSKAAEKVTVSVTYENGESRSEDVGVYWDPLGGDGGPKYNPGSTTAQVIKGELNIPSSSFLNNLPDEWKSKLEGLAAEVEIIPYDNNVGMTIVEAQPFSATGFLGNKFEELSGVPGGVTLRVTTATGQTPEYDVSINWDPGYDPLKPSQVITGKPDLSASSSFESYTGDIPTVTLNITLTPDPNDKVAGITPITPVYVAGILDAPFEQQPFPEQVPVRITYKSGRTEDVAVPVSWNSAGFNPSLGGAQEISGTIGASEKIPEDTAPALLGITASLNLQARGTGVILPDIPPVKGFLGESKEELQKRVSTVLEIKIKTSEGKEVSMEEEVLWNWSDYKSDLPEQIIHGTLSMSSSSLLQDIPSPDVQLVVKLSEKPTYAVDFEKDYDGKKMALPIDKPEGCTKAEVVYEGNTLAGVHIKSGTAPTEAGAYTASVSLTMAPGYAEIDSITVKYVINQAEQPFDTPVKIAYTQNNTIGVVPVEGAEYRIGNGNWQDSPNFSGLTPNTEYTISQRLKATVDQNKKASVETTTKATTQGRTFTGIAVPFNAPFTSKIYDGMGLLDSLKSGFYTFNYAGTGNVTITVKAYLSDDLDPREIPQGYESLSLVKNPTTVGPYIVVYELPQGYVWADNGSRTMEDGIWITPKFGDIYVGDQRADITMEGGVPDANSSSDNYSLTFSLGTGDSQPFDTSRTGETLLSVDAVKGGASAQTLTSAFPVTVLPWVITDKDTPTIKISNDAVFGADLLPGTISVTAKAHEKSQTFQVPVVWETAGYDQSQTTQTISGTLNFTGIPELNGSSDTNVSVVVTRLAAPVYVPVDTALVSKIYDGTGLVDAGKDYEITVGDVNVPVQRTAYLAAENTAVENPVAAGKYVIRSVLPEGYLWEGTTSDETESILWIYPAVSPVYVGEQLSDATLETGNGAYTFQFSLNPDFNSSASGVQTVSVNASCSGDTESISLDVRVLPWAVTGKKPVEITGELGTEFSALTKPGVVAVTAAGNTGERQFNVPVEWSDLGYDALSGLQTIPGTLDFSSIPELAGTEDATMSATVRLSMKTVPSPVIDPFTKTYDGSATPLPTLTLPTGMESCSVTYAGTDNTGLSYGPAADAPVNAGEYTATVSFVMSAGYEQTASVDVPYTIHKAALPGIESVSTIIASYDSIVMTPITGAEYSLDGVTWQSSNSFNSLHPNTSYTVYVRMPATADGNYAPSEPTTLSVVTTKRDAQAPALAPKTVTYSGEAIAYTVPAITGVSEVSVAYLQDGTVLDSAPTDAGVYDISITYQMETGYKQLDPMTSKLTILKAPQAAPVAAVTAATDTTLMISNLSGAEYSINGGDTWQTSHSFTGLERNTQYTVLVRLAEDKNHEASPATEVKGYTTATTSEVPSMLPAYSVIYDGTAKEYAYAETLADIDGVQSMAVTYSGTTNAGAAYRSATPPTEAGQYAVTISLTAKPGYILAQSVIGTKQTIERAPQTLAEAPSIARVTTATVTVNPIAGAEYSGNNGATWQTSNSFTGLSPQTSFIILVRLAETPNYLASESYSLPAQTLDNTGLTYNIDFRNETIQFNEQVVEMSMTSFFNGTISSGTAVTPGLKLFARLIDNGAGVPSSVSNISIPARPAAPDVRCDTAAYTLNTTAAMEYSADEGATWTACEENMDVTYMGGSVLLVRYAATDESFRSAAKNVFVPVRPDAPALTVNLKTERVNVTSAMEYSTNGAASWQPCQPDMSVANLAGETIMVRKKATATSPASTSAFLNIPERADDPKYNILMYSEQMTSDAPFEYCLNGVWSAAETLQLSNLSGQTILIQTPSGNEKFASSRVSVSIPVRGETPVVEIEEKTLAINTAIGMEYSVDNGASWNPAEVNMDISAFAGKTMLIRRTVTETMFASNPAVVQIRSLGMAPEVSVDTVREVLNTTAEMEYSTDGGKSWTSAPDELDVSNLTGGTLEVRMRGTDTEFPSESVTVEIPARNEVPDVSMDMVTGQFAAPAGTQYSADDGESWMDAPASIMESMYGKTFLFRTPADAAHFASFSVPVALPSRSDGPAVSFNMKDLTVNTTSTMEYSIDGGKTWAPAPDGLDASGLLGRTLLVRYPASSTAPASSVTSLELPAGASVPVVSVDCANEQLIASERTLEWSQDGGHSWSVCKTPMNVGDYASKELLFRTPGTTGGPSSASVPVTVPVREKVPAVEVDLDAESINTTPAMEYSLNGGLSWVPAPMGLDVSMMTGDAVLVRTAHTDSSFASMALSVTIPSRADAVDVPVDMEKETLATTTGMDYSLDNGSTWTQAHAGLNVSGMTGSVVLVRSLGSGFQFASEPVSVSIPIRREMPRVYANLRNELFSVSDGAEFSGDGGRTWTGVPAFITAKMLGTTVLFRFPADENQFASAAVSVTLPARPDGPTLTLDRETMTVNTTIDMEYSTDGVDWMPAPENMDVSEYQNRTLQFRYAAYDTAPASSVTKLNIPAVTPAPVLSLDLTNERIVSADEGAVLEYSADNGETWKSCVMPMEIGDLAGKTIIFRTPADGEIPCSVSVVARIPARMEKPAASLDLAEEKVTVDPSEGLSYSADSGETWTQMDGALDISSLVGKTVLVRVSCTTENLASEPVAVVIPTRNPAPAAVIDMAAETLSADSSMEFSVDGGATWSPASENLDVSGMAGEILIFRYASTETALHSESAMIAVPERLNVPAVSADMRSGKFTVPEGIEFSSDEGKTWGSVPVSIGEDLLGKTVRFRFPATEKNFASANAVISLPAHSDGPVLVLNVEALTVNTDSGMEYSIDNGATWHKCVKNMSVSKLLGMTLTVRYAATKNAPVSSETTLVIPTRKSAPLVTVYNVSAYGRHDGVIMGIDPSMEYRRVGVTSWIRVMGTSIGYLPAGTYEIRYAAASGSIASEVCTVVIRSPGPDQPNPDPVRPDSNSGNHSYPGFYPGGIHPGSSGSVGASGSKSFLVKFETNGGSAVRSQTVDKNSPVNVPETPTKDGCIFCGWYTDAKLTNLYDFESKVKKGFTLYAKWEEIVSIDPGYVDPTPVDPVPIDPAPVNSPAQTNTALVDGDNGISYVNGRSAGKFEPNEGITRGEVAVILYRLMDESARAQFYSQSNDFVDVGNDSWYNEAISTFVQAGVLGGYGDGAFHPDQPITRAELTAILIRVQGGAASEGNTTFTDTDGHWAEGYISSAVTAGLVFGYDDGTFKPNRNITRAEAVAMTNRMLMRSPIDSSYAGSLSFTDVQSSDWFYGDVMAAANGYLN